LVTIFTIFLFKHKTRHCNILFLFQIRVCVFSPKPKPQNQKLARVQNRAQIFSSLSVIGAYSSLFPTPSNVFRFLQLPKFRISINFYPISDSKGVFSPIFFCFVLGFFTCPFYFFFLLFDFYLHVQHSFIK
jgi:hypothetical protein